MNSDTYIQYATLNGNIRTIEVEREVVDTKIRFTVQGIQEDFFLLNLFDKNKKVEGLTFDNVQNLQMLSFLNSDFQTLEAIPEQFYFKAFDVIEISMDVPVLGGVPDPQNVVVTNFEDAVNVVSLSETSNNPVHVSNLPEMQTVWVNNPTMVVSVDNLPSVQNVSIQDTVLLRQENIDTYCLYGVVPPSRYYIELDPLSVGKPLNLNIEGFSLECLSYGIGTVSNVKRDLIYYDTPINNPNTFSVQPDFNINVQSVIKNTTVNLNGATSSFSGFSLEWLGFNFIIFSTVTGVNPMNFKFLVDKQYNIYNIIGHAGSTLTYIGCRLGAHIFKLDGYSAYVAVSYGSVPVLN